MIIPDEADDLVCRTPLEGIAALRSNIDWHRSQIRARSAIDLDQ